MRQIYTRETEQPVVASGHSDCDAPRTLCEGRPVCATSKTERTYIASRSPTQESNDPRKSVVRKSFNDERRRDLISGYGGDGKYLPTPKIWKRTFPGMNGGTQKHPRMFPTTEKLQNLLFQM